MSDASAEPAAAVAVAGRGQEPIFTLPFVSLMTANGLLRICTYMLITVVPLYALHNGVSLTEAGLTTTFYMAAAVVVRPLSGQLVDARGRFAVMLVGSVLYFVATGLYVLALPVWLLLAVRALQGLGFSFNGTAVMTLATDLIPESRMSEGIGYLGIEQTVAQIFAPWLALTLVDAYGYRAAFVVVFVLAGVNLLVRLPLGRVAAQHRREREREAGGSGAAADADTGSGTGGGARSGAGAGASAGGAAGKAPATGGESGAGAEAARPPWWSRLVDRDAARPAAIMFFIMSGVAAINTFMAAYTTGRGIANSGLFFTASGVMLAVARIGGGRLQRRFGVTRTIAAGILAVVAGLLLVYWSPDLGVLMAGGAFYGWGMGTAQPGMSALAVLAADKSRRGLANSTFFMAMDLSQAVDAAALGALAGLAGTGSVFLASAAVVAASAVAFVVVRSRGAVP
ncbi:MFS transporter [Streptomyces sp. CA2R106]|uniref:MFS transporter n=1 Tax=Streptomyces sp. CA2R106 TaxID=3120153 RepID=UPI00300A92D0